MYEKIASEAGLNFFATAGMLMFFAIFSAVVLWISTRSKKEVQAWATLPLADDPPAGSNRPRNDPSKS